MSDLKKLEIQLEFLNFKNLKNQEIKLQGSNLYFIEGKNKRGKSSIIHGIVSLLEAKNNIKEAIKTGEKKGKVRGRLPGPNGEVYSINMEITPSNTSFTMVKPNGDVVTRVTDMRNILQYNSLNVNDFVNLSHTAAGRKKQIEIIINLLPEDIKHKFLTNLDLIEPNKGQAFLKRKDAKANYERLENQYSNIVIPENIDDYEDLSNKKNIIIEELNKGRIKYSELNDEINKLNSNQVKFLQEKTVVENFVENEADNQINDLNDEIKKLKQKLDEVVRKKEESISFLKDADEYVSKSKEIIDNKNEELSKISETVKTIENSLSDVNEKIGTSKAYNGQIAKKTETKKLLDTAKKRYDATEENLTNLRLENEKIVEESDLGKYNIDIKDGYIHIGEFIMDENQVCKSDLMLTLLPILIKSNKCPIVTMSDGESLDEDNINKFHSIVEEHDVIAFMDRVNNDYDELTLTGFENTSDVEVTFLENVKTSNDETNETTDEAPQRPSFI